jgi:hypothetical protein
MSGVSFSDSRSRHDLADAMITQPDTTGSSSSEPAETAESADVINDWTDRLHTMSSKVNNPNTVQYLTRRVELGVDEGHCQYFIRRKNRYCSHRCVAGSTTGFCSEHSPASLEESREKDLVSRRRHESRECLNDVISRIINGHRPESDQVDPTDGEEAAENASVSEENTSKTRSRGKRVSAPKRMANPYR